MVLGAAAWCSIWISSHPLPPGASKVAQVKDWYEGALVQTQERSLGKFHNAEVLEAMAAKVLPDWSQAVTVGLGDGVTCVTTVLGPGQPSTTHSHGELGAVRAVDISTSRLWEHLSLDEWRNGYDILQ